MEEYIPRSQFPIFMKKIFFVSLFFCLLNIPLEADDHSFEDWNKKQFENYPFECVEDGATPEYTRCYAEKLNKYDWDLRKELNDGSKLGFSSK